MDWVKQNPGIAIIGGAVIFVIGLALVGFWAIPLVAAAAAAVWFATTQNPAANTVPSATETVSSPAVKSVPDSDPQYVFNKLLETSQTLRTTEGVTDEVLKPAESIIDSLWDLIPGLTENHQHDELAFETCRIGTYHLPRLLDPYFSARADARAEVAEQVAVALNALNKQVSEISELIKNQQTGDALHRAKSVEMRFSSFRQ